MNESSRVADGRSDNNPEPVGFDTFRELLLSQTCVDALLQGVCAQVVATVPGADMAGVMLLDELAAGPATAACTDRRVFTIDDDQYRANEGPSLEAARTRQLVRAGANDAAARWPTFARKAADIGVQGYLSAPISVDTGQVGALNVYSWTDHGFTHTDEILVQVFVTAVESAVFNSLRAQHARSELDGLREAMRTRAAIEQAKGIVMAVRGVDADEAFAVLSQQSQNENMKVSAIAARIIDSVQREP
ncbi:MAG: ANTAR domain-containing protein [Rhodococcus sp. (in: high G+C Gram-positive bacteria)]